MCEKRIEEKISLFQKKFLQINGFQLCFITLSFIAGSLLDLCSKIIGTVNYFDLLVWGWFFGGFFFLVFGFFFFSGRVTEWQRLSRKGFFKIMTCLMVKTLSCCKHYQLFRVFYFQVFWLIFPSAFLVLLVRKEGWLPSVRVLKSESFLHWGCYHHFAPLNEPGLKRPTHLIQHHCTDFFNRDLCHQLMFLVTKTFNSRGNVIQCIS